MAVQFKDYYEILGVPRTGNEDDIRKAYRTLARKHHPDVNPGDHAAEDRFKDINEAYEVLSDPEKRRRYDQAGANTSAGSDFTPPPGWQSAGPDSNGFGEAFTAGGNGSDFFESLFGRRHGRSGAGFQMRGEDINAEIALTIQEAHRGVTRGLRLRVSEPCPDCNGTGLKDGKTCPTCLGRGTIRRERALDVTIPRGVRDGSVIRLAGQGEPGANGAPPGDLYLEVRIEPDAVFDLIDTDDVQVRMPIAPWEAVLGAKIIVPTLDGQVEMKVPAGTQAGRRLRLRGQGLNRRDGGRGDEYVELTIVIPPKLTVEEKRLFEKLAEESQFDARSMMAKGEL